MMILNDNIDAADGEKDQRQLRMRVYMDKFTFFGKTPNFRLFMDIHFVVVSSSLGHGEHSIYVYI